SPQYLLTKNDMVAAKDKQKDRNEAAESVPEKNIGCFVAGKCQAQSVKHILAHAEKAVAAIETFIPYHVVQNILLLVTDHCFYVPQHSSFEEDQRHRMGKK